MIYLTLLTGPYSPDIECIQGMGANGPQENKLERTDTVTVTCELVEEIVKAIINNPTKEKKNGENDIGRIEKK